MPNQSTFLNSTASSGDAYSVNYDTANGTVLINDADKVPNYARCKLAFISFTPTSPGSFQLLDGTTVIYQRAFQANQSFDFSAEKDMPSPCTNLGVRMGFKATVTLGTVFINTFVGSTL